MVDLSLIRCAATMPEEHPLQGVVAFEFVFEAKGVFFVGEFEEVEELRRGFEAGEGWRLGVVDEGGDAAVGVEAEELEYQMF